MRRDDIDDRLDAQLRAAFAPPPLEFAALAARVVAPAPRRWPWLLAAAALLIAGALWALRGPRGTAADRGREVGAMWVAAYEHALAEGFADGACCQPNLDLRQACEQRFATQLDLTPSSVHLLGCYCGLPTGGSMAILARTNDTPVCVYVLPRARDPHPVLPEGSRFELARRELGDLVLYAISASVSAATLAEFVVP